MKENSKPGRNKCPRGQRGFSDQEGTRTLLVQTHRQQGASLLLGRGGGLLPGRVLSRHQIPVSENDELFWVSGAPSGREGLVESTARDHPYIRSQWRQSSIILELELKITSSRYMHCEGLDCFCPCHSYSLGQFHIIQL